MNKKSIFGRICVVVIVLAIVVIPTVFADIGTTMPNGEGSVTRVDTSVKKIWSTVILIVQILAFAAVVFAGLRYMFTSADQKADIKKSMGILALGAALVFAASTVVGFITGGAVEILGQ